MVFVFVMETAATGTYTGGSGASVRCVKETGPDGGVVGQGVGGSDDPARRRADAREKGVGRQHLPGVAPVAQPGAAEQRRESQVAAQQVVVCLLYTSPSPRDRTRSRMPSSA